MLIIKLNKTSKHINSYILEKLQKHWWQTISLEEIICLVRKPRNRSLRAIIVPFLDYGDKDLVLHKAWKYLKDTDVHLYDDILKLLYDSRNGEIKNLQEAREKGTSA